MSDKIITFTSAGSCACCAPSSFELWTWGGNGAGQIGIGDTTNRNAPVQIGITEWADGATNLGSTMAIKSDGTLWAWGLNDHGQLGLGDTTARSSPVQVGTDTDWEFVTSPKSYAFSTVDGSTFAIKTDGTLWTWGANGQGQLGLGDFTQRTTPVKVGSATDWGSSIFLAGDYVIVLKSNGTLWSWGYNGHSQLGQGDYTNRTSPTQIGSASNWMTVSKSVSFGVVALKTDGTLWTWGWGRVQLGNSATLLMDQPVPTRVGSDSDWAKVYTGSDIMAAIKTNGTLWVWGNDGFGIISNVFDPTQIGSATNWDVFSDENPIPGSYFGIKTNGELWSWGKNTNGILGLGDTTDRSSPVQVGTDTDWAFVQYAPRSVFALKTDGTLWTWGANNIGQLGLGDTTDRHVPTKVGAAVWDSVQSSTFNAGFNTIFAFK